MSTVSSLVVFLVLVCVSFHACHARRLGEVAKAIEKESLVPNKDVEKLDHARPSSLETKNGDMVVNQDRVEKDDQKSIAPKTKGFEEEEEAKDQSSDDLETEQSLDTVSWRIPHKKRGERQPGFNLDYSPPKTHPPVHN